MVLQTGYANPMPTLMMIMLNAGMSLVLVALGGGCAWIAHALTPPHRGGPRRGRGLSTAVSKLLI
jgi:hypothetical protein